MTLNRNYIAARRTVAALIAVAAAAAGLSGPADAAIVHFRKSVQCSSSVVTLGEIADVRDADPAVVAQLSEIVVAPAPVPGRRLRLDFDSIRSRLRAHGVDTVRTEFGGAGVVTVTSGQTLANANDASQTGGDVPEWKMKRAERLASEAIRQYLRGAAPELGAVALSIDLEAADVEELLLGAATGYQVRGGTPPWNSPQVFQLRFLDRREQIHTVTVRAGIAPQPQVVAAKYDIPRGHVLQADDLVWRQADTAENATTDAVQVIHHETTRMLRANEPISRDDVRAVPLIRSNDIVTVYANAHGLKVKRRMKSRSDGAMGEMVTLVSLDGKQTLSARVVGYHEAEIAAPATTARFEPSPARPARSAAVPPPQATIQTINVDSFHRPQRPASTAVIGRR